MKLSNKEKIILAVFLSIVIIAVGIFLIILPEYNKISTNKSELDGAKAQREQLFQTLTREATIDGEIETAIKNANVFSGYFYDDMTTYEADVLVRQILTDNNMSTNGLSIGDFTTSTLTVSEYVEAVVSYPLKDYSGFVPDSGIDFSQFQISYDENGNMVIPEELQDQMIDVLKEFMNTLLSTQQQTLGSISVTMTVTGTRGDFLKFLDNVAALEKATYIPSVSIAYTGMEAAANQQPQTPAEGAEGGEQQPAAPVQTETELTEESEISASITMTFYCAKALQTDAVNQTRPEVTQPVEAA